MRATLKAIRERLRKRRDEPVPVVGRWLGAVVNGYLNYHAVPDNLVRLNSFHKEVCRAWLAALRRRSQRQRMPWSRFKRLVAHPSSAVRPKFFSESDARRSTKSMA